MTRYWYAPLRPEPGNLFTTPDHVNPKIKDPLYVGEIRKDEYDRMMQNRLLGSEEIDDLGLPTLPTTDELGL